MCQPQTAPALSLRHRIASVRGGAYGKAGRAASAAVSFHDSMSTLQQSTNMAAAKSRTTRKPRGDLLPADWPALKIELRSVSSLKPYARNSRTHSKEQVTKLTNSVREWGWTIPILVDENDQVIAGHGRLLAAEALKIEQVPVMVARGWSDEKKRAYVIADNQLALEAGWDRTLLGEELFELQKLNFDLSLTGFDALDLKALMRMHTLVGDPEVLPDVPEEKDVVSKPGDLWILGDHRLLCGDSTNVEHVTRLMDGQRAHLLATDPPYLVDYDGTNHPADHHVRAGRTPKTPGKQVGNKHWDDYVDPESSIDFFSAFLAAALPHCIDRVPIYQWHATRRQVLVERAWERNSLLVHQTIIWVKPRAVLTRSHYLWQHEPCFYGWIEGKMPEKGRRPATTSTTVWQIDQADEPKGLHPTIKPLEIFLRPIEAHTKPGEICLEPFSGSGTQIAAAERLARRCFAMELSPAFVDVRGSQGAPQRSTATAGRSRSTRRSDALKRSQRVVGASGSRWARSAER
jgi:DNA modification methylase